MTNKKYVRKERKKERKKMKFVLVGVVLVGGG
jgi:hypothetical protein